MAITYRKAFSAEKDSSTDVAVSRYEEGDGVQPTIILTIGADYGRVTSQMHMTVADAKNLASLLAESLEVVTQ